MNFLFEIFLNQIPRESRKLAESTTKNDQIKIFNNHYLEMFWIRIRSDLKKLDPVCLYVNTIWRPEDAHCPHLRILVHTHDTLVFY